MLKFFWKGFGEGVFFQKEAFPEYAIIYYVYRTAIRGAMSSLRA